MPRKNARQELEKLRDETRKSLDLVDEHLRRVIACQGVTLNAMAELSAQLERARKAAQSRNLGASRRAFNRKRKS